MLSRYFKPMLVKYTGNYFFEINPAVVSMHHFVTTLDSDMKVFATILPSNIDSISKSVLSDLFGNDVHNIDEITKMYNVKLPHVNMKTLPNKKLSSLVLKYFFIPPKELSYRYD